jgi:hypothetical protein
LVVLSTRRKPTVFGAPATVNGLYAPLCDSCSIFAEVGGLIRCASDKTE